MGEAAAWSGDDAEVTGGRPDADDGADARDQTHAVGHVPASGDSAQEAAGPDHGSGDGPDQSTGEDGRSEAPRGRRRLSALIGSWPPQQWPLAIVIGGLGLSLLVVAVDDFRPGTVLFSGCLLLAALFRLVLPDRQAGLLVLRSRVIDVLLMLLLGICILLLALLVPDLPEGGLPAVQQ